MLEIKNTQKSDKEILENFFERRKIFDNFIKNKALKLCTCPGCGYPTLSDRGNYEICFVCNWEDNFQDDDDADKVFGGPNGGLSLTENRINIGQTLTKIAQSFQSNISLDPHYVLSTIKFHNDKRKKIEKRMTGDETLEHPIWAEWKQVEKDLQIALCKQE